MADLYGLGMSGIPPEYQAQIRRAQQQQMIAQSLFEQSQDPLQSNQTAGGYVVPVNPLQGLAKVAQAYVGARGMRNANDAHAAVGEKFQADQNAAISKVQAAMAPTAATPIPLANANGVDGQMIERTSAEKRAAAQEALLSQFPTVRNFGTVLNSNLQADQAREDNQLFRSQEAQLTRDQREHERALAIEERKRQEAERFQQQKELKEMVASGQGQSPYFTPVQTANGVFAFNARTGKVEPVAAPDGSPVVGAQFDPSLQGSLANAKEGGKVEGKSAAESRIELPTAIDKAALASKQIDDLLAHPGFESTVGATMKPGARFVDGTHEADFMKRLDQLQGGAFLQAFEALKGGGHITEIEGKKATEAIARMNKSQSEDEFKTAAKEFQKFINDGVERSRVKAGGAPAGGFDAGKEARYQAWKKSQGL